MKHIGIIGTRRRDTSEAYSKIQEKFFEIFEDGDWIVSGGCPKGGDRFAEKLAKEYGIPIIIFYPNWKKYGKNAGFVRNADIAKKSDIIIACVSKDRTGGTEHTLRKFKEFLKTEIYVV
jgi:YspA, cpYpsA-related SLOG family